ncbi:hypothetical protein LPB137_04175 [Poseidonibacter parvus]|uniref:Uncharacterized protein n=1 Tax=Poseidonibacter parvus TaxID=1850254 RepID=A0A1P8KKK9_9BACT|nr:hypothetical protein [Poseidonibacter parvus]APW65092.1 hypothetical protein LPB137_04175 [Poseidonibacter parvus]
MQIILFSLIILAVLIYIIYKIKRSFTKKDFIIFFVIITAIIIAITYYNNSQEQKLPNAFKANYLQEKNIEISKLSYTQVNFEVLRSTKFVYDFLYIIKKNDKEYVCEAKNVEVQKIEDEYIFKKYNENCRLK